jgi:hypothetical protein
MVDPVDDGWVHNKLLYLSWCRQSECITQSQLRSNLFPARYDSATRCQNLCVMSIIPQLKSQLKSTLHVANKLYVEASSMIRNQTDCVKTS